MVEFQKNSKTAPKKMKIDVELDFEQLDKLPFEEYNQLESKFLKLLTEAITNAEKDYCKKKGKTKEELSKDYTSYRKMQNAINNRRDIRKLSNTCMRFNKLLRPYIKEVKE